MGKTFEPLLFQQMTRREFITKIGLFLLAITGINALIKSFSPSSMQQEQNSGFGSGPYGK